MKMVIKQMLQIQKVKNVEVLRKVYCLEFYTGRGTASVAEQIHSTVEEAQKIIDDFFEAYPAIKQFTEVTQQKAKQNGYTETAWGRRRYLKHIQDEPYEYKYNEKRQVDFNPLFTAKSVINKQVPQNIKDEYNAKLEKANYYYRNKIIEQAAKDGIDIINNGGFIAESLRQCVNSTIQGEPNRLNCPYTLNPITQGCTNK